MDPKQLKRLEQIEVEIRELRERLLQLEEQRAVIQKMEIDDVLDHLELTELHLDQLKKNLSEAWYDLTDWVRETARKKGTR